MLIAFIASWGTLALALPLLLVPIAIFASVLRGRHSERSRLRSHGGAAETPRIEVEKPSTGPE